MDMTMERTWRGRVFIGMSLDGYIARPDSDLRWLTDPPADITHEHIITSDRRALEWDTFICDIDHIVMGRCTYNKALTFGAAPGGRAAGYLRAVGTRGRQPAGPAPGPRPMPATPA
jgi:hypothetical protein